MGRREARTDAPPHSSRRKRSVFPESVVGKQLRDRFAHLDQSFTGTNPLWAAVVRLIGLTAMCPQGVIDLEKEVIALKREVRARGTT